MNLDFALDNSGCSGIWPNLDPFCRVWSDLDAGPAPTKKIKILVYLKYIIFA